MATAVYFMDSTVSMTLRKVSEVQFLLSSSNSLCKSMSKFDFFPKISIYEASHPSPTFSPQITASHHYLELLLPTRWIPAVVRGNLEAQFPRRAPKRQV